MANERADIFADSGLDLSRFKPKGADTPSRPGADALVGAGQGRFVSREPSPPKPAGKWRYRTGRDKQFNTRASQATIDGFTALAERLNCPIAEVIERALAALQRESERTG